jgi:N-acetylglucosamine kinase-like BadF-type ATPase
MQIIADSGSTKTTWCVVDQGIQHKKIQTSGINPFYQTEEEISLLIAEFVVPETAGINISDIWFYGAGCAFPDKKLMISGALSSYYQNAVIDVESDLLAAARSLFQREEGIACILGTGSNSCLYDGMQIVQNVSPLGFILGDEGSGAFLGKMLVADCLKNQLPDWLRDKFLDEYELTPAIILENVYKKPFPNRYLARFTPFLNEFIEEPAIFNLVYNSFEAFFVRNIFQYPIENMKVSFAGSVAYHFKDTLEIVASECNILIDKIVQDPMEGLILYHSA